MPIYDYFYFLEFIPYGLNPAGKTCLVVGLGAGIIPMWYESMGIATDVVDIDPHVVDIARDYFGFRSRGAVQIADARHYLTASGKRYDYIILDVFNGDTTPGYLLSREAVSLLKNRLAGNGILAINLIGGLKEDTLMTASVVKTLRGVFRTVEIYPTFSVSYSDGSGNLALVAYDADTLRFNPDAVKGFPVHPFADISVTQLLGTTFSFPPHADALMLSDDYNPIDFYDLGHKEKVRENVLRNTDADILL
jgi:spermidine synthase